jgi:hypothetical protein
VPDARGSVFLVGDSNAGQFTEPVARAANAASLNFTVATHTGCPFADVVTEYASSFDTSGCRRFVEGTIRGLARLRPSLVVVASSSTEYLHAGNGVTFRDRAGRVAKTEQEKARMWRDGLASALHTLDEAGVPVLVVHTVPHFSDFDLRLCPVFRLYRDPGTCGRSITRAEVAGQQRLAASAESAAVAGARRATAIDLTDDLCTPTDCSTYRSGQWIYRDGAHITVGAALKLTGRFTKAIETLVR